MNDVRFKCTGFDRALIARISNNRAGESVFVTGGQDNDVGSAAPSAHRDILRK